jgi:xanthine/CO dehydrogenase XdhC/CoxF family maturation factor
VAEIDRILEAIREWSDRGIDFALATVVGVRGSTYRGLAARQLISVEGASVGTVSGGCLDGDLRVVAAEVAASNEARIIEFDLTADDEAVWGWGIGCNGATRLLVEPAAGAIDLADRIGVVHAAQRPAAIVHVTGGAAVGIRWVVTHGDADDAAPDAVVADARAALADGRHRLVSAGGLDALIEVVGSPSRLVVCGAGHDAVPLVHYGAELGFEVIVVDDRRQFLTAERFPAASALIHVEPRDLGAAVDLDLRSHVILMSHNYLRDLDYLSCLVGSDVSYVGALGPGDRLGRLLKDLESEGIAVRDVDRAKLHGPAGLDIGAEGPVEIAWSILAEVLAVRRGKVGGFLRARKGPSVSEVDPAG